MEGFKNILVVGGEGAASVCSSLAASGASFCVARVDGAAETSGAAGSYALSKFDAAEIAHAVVNAAETMGSIDELVFICRPGTGTDDRLLNLEEEDWARAERRGPAAFFLFVKYAAPYLVSAQRSRIVVLADDAGADAAELAALASVEASCRIFGDELSDYGVTIEFRPLASGL